MIIFVHGLGQKAESWKQTIEDLSVREQTVCPELSAILQNTEVTYTNLYKKFADYCNQFQEPFTICGLSLGGILALQHAIEYSSKIQSLILIGTQYAMPKLLLQFQNIIFRWMPDTMFSQMGFGKEDFIRLSKSMMKLDFTEDMKKINCPILIICGEKDSANKKAADRMTRMLPRAEYAIIQEAGHEVNVDKPEILAETIDSFLRRN